MNRKSRNDLDLTRQVNSAEAIRVVRNTIPRRLPKRASVTVPSQVVPDVEVVYVYPN